MLPTSAVSGFYFAPPGQPVFQSRAHRPRPARGLCRAPRSLGRMRRALVEAQSRLNLAARLGARDGCGSGSRGQRGRSARSWGDELRAMLALAWPLILSNVTFQVIQATDVVLMGWLGARQLAASALAINLTWPITFLAFGVVTASSPLMATVLGAKSHCGARRQANLPAVAVGRGNRERAAVAAPVECGKRSSCCSASSRSWRATAACSSRAIGGRSCPGCCSRRCATSCRLALERPLIVISAVGIVLNAVLGWALIFGRLGLRALGIFGGGLASSITWTLLALGLALVIVSDRQFRRFHLFGNWWRSDWAPSAPCPAGPADRACLRVRGRGVRGRGLSDGPDRCRQRCRPRHCAPDRRAELHGTAGPQPGGHRARRPRARTPRSLRDQPRRLDRLASGRRLHGSDGAADVGGAASAGRPVPRARGSRHCASPTWPSPSLPLRPFSRSPTAPRWSARACFADFTIPGCRCCSRCSAIGSSGSAPASGLPCRLGGRRSVGRPRRRPGCRIATDDVALEPPRCTGADLRHRMSLMTRGC